MPSKKLSCCQGKTGKSPKSGWLYGLLPHSFCLAFIVFSFVGATAATTFLRRFLANPNFFWYLNGASMLMAVLAAAIYLKKQGGISRENLIRHRQYLALLFTSMVTVNLLMFLVVFPALANFGARKTNQSVVLAGESAIVTLKVEIPCSGHAPLIIDELKNLNGVTSVKYLLPNLFVVNFDPEVTSETEIRSLPIFEDFPAQL